MPALFRVLRSWFIVNRKKQITLAPNDKRQTTNQRGFSLIELLITISIIAIISAIGIISYSQAQKLARDGKRKQDLRAIKIALEIYYQQNKRYPCPNGGDAWVYSSSPNPWIIDSGFSAICSDTTSQKDLGPNYISRVPTDPINSGGSPSTTSGYTYGYRGYHGTQCPSRAGQFFILVAQLENKNDPDRNQIRQVKDCGGVISTTTGVGWDTSFVLTSDE